MSNKVKFTSEQKMFLVLKFRELKISLSAFCRMYNVERTAIHRWSIKYDNEGLKGLEEIKKTTKYSSHTLINAVEDYLTGNFSMLQIVKKYNLSGDSVLRQWLKWYNTSKWNLKVGEFMDREKIKKNKNVKSKNNLSEKEILIRKNKELEKKNKMLEAELLLIKKLKELERSVK